MGMSTHVVGFRHADSRWIKMKQVWDACEEAGVDPPKEVIDFFSGEYPGEKPGMEIDISKAVEKYHANAVDGFQVDITSLPENVRYIRFYNSY